MQKAVAPENGRLALWRDVLRHAVDHRITGLAAEVAFFAVLSLFPGLLALAAALGSLEAIIGGDLARQGKAAVIRFLSQTLTERASATVDAVRQLFEGQRTGLLTIGAVFLLWALSRGFAAAIRALNIAYGLRDQRPWWRTRLLALGLSFGSVIVFALMISMVVLGPLLGLARVGGNAARVLSWLGPVAALLLLLVWAVTLFHVSLARRIGWHRDLPGALLTGLLWLAISVGFRAYLAVAAAGNPIFGVLGGGLILLLWIYLLSVALLLGGELNAALSRRGPARTAAPAAFDVSAGVRSTS